MSNRKQLDMSVEITRKRVRVPRLRISRLRGATVAIEAKVPKLVVRESELIAEMEPLSLPCPEPEVAQAVQVCVPAEQPVAVVAPEAAPSSIPEPVPQRASKPVAASTREPVPPSAPEPAPRRAPKPLAPRTREPVPPSAPEPAPSRIQEPAPAPKPLAVSTREPVPESVPKSVPAPRKRRPRTPKAEVSPAPVAAPVPEPRPIKVIRRRGQQAKVFETMIRGLPRAMLEGVEVAPEDEGELFSE